MENQNVRAGHGRSKGFRLGRVNLLLIFIGFVIALGMVFNMYETNRSFDQVVSMTEAYLSSQQTAGMLSGIASGMAEQCAAFLESGKPDCVHAWAGQLGAINAQIAENETFQTDEINNDEFLDKAIEAFRAMNETELRAMRLMADTLPVPMAAYPDQIQQAELSEADQALTAEEKKALAEQLIDSEEYRQNRETIATAVDDSHRETSEKGKNRAEQTSAQMKKGLSIQKLLIFGFVFIALVALLINRSLIIAPIQRSADKLDKREPLPVRGSYEVRHLANVYNEVLKDNAEKTEAMSYAATHDALTGLYNRADFDQEYNARANDRIGILIVDVDHFKQFNDEFGHEVGDRVLKIVADKLTEHFRREDHISRIGGDEFCVILPGTKQVQGEIIARKIRQINRELQENTNDLPTITISGGLAFWDRPEPGESLFRDADSMLLSLKKTRTDCCAVYPG